MNRLITNAILTLVALPCLSLGYLRPPSHPLFDSDAVHEIRLTFHQQSWWDSLRVNFEGQDDPQYMTAEFEWGEIHFDSIGVRFKGNSSYSYPGVKKSFKLDINEYVEDQEIFGLDKLNLNNSFKDPSFVREKCCYELCDAVGLPTVRTNYAALYINDEYWGLYTLVEQFDQQFIESRFGADEEGNLWKAEHGTFEYLGPDADPYRSGYELENNEDADDWSALIHITDVLNNTPIGNLPDSLHNIVDVNSALAMLAIDLFAVNLDSYVGRGGNFYIYNRNLDNRMIFAKWDVNEAWGVFSMWPIPPLQLMQLSPFWVSPNPNDHRPLAERLWEIDAFENIYLGHFRSLMAGKGHPDSLIARMESLRVLIQPFVYADVNKMFTNTEFDNALSMDIGAGPGRIPALEPFIRGRDTWLRSQIGEWSRIDGLVINELMANNNETIADEHGEYNDWIEIYNRGASPVNLAGLGLIDHMDGTEALLFGDTSLAPGAYLLVWADEQPEQGPFHAPFKLDADGEDVFLFDGGVIVDQTTFYSLNSDESYGRLPNGTGEWQVMNQATPGTSNETNTSQEEAVPALPQGIALYQNYPNPFNPATTIAFDLAKSAEVKLEVFDVLGQQVAVLVNESLNAGRHEKLFDGSNLSSGLYFYQLSANNLKSTGKMILLK
jgi:hypothetical protein